MDKRGCIVLFIGIACVIVLALIWFFKGSSVESSPPRLGSRCDQSNELSCSSPNLICSTDSTCDCAPNFVVIESSYRNYVCIKKRAYGEECPPGRSDTCSNRDTVCVRDVHGTSRCICGRDFYRNGNVNCSSVHDLAVFKVTATSTTNKVTLTWTTDKHGLNTRYSVTSDQREGQLEGHVTDTGAVWCNLTPGKKYSFKITTTVPADSIYDVKQVVVNKGDVWTGAGKPGSVVSVKPLPGLQYEVTFQPSPGHVKSYTLVINGEQVSGTNTKYTLISLYPGQNCTYNITAYNGIQNPSEVSVGTFRLNRTCPGEVRSLTATKDDDNALVLTFLCPDPRDVPNNVQGYMIQKILLTPSGLTETNTSYRLPASRVSCTNSVNDGALGVVMGERTYKFSIKAWNDDFVGKYSKEIIFYVEPRVPKLSLDYDGIKLLQKEKNSDLSNTEFEVRVCSHCLLDSTRGKVLGVGLVVCVEADGSRCTATVVRQLNNFKTWNDAKNKNFTMPYLTTPSDWMTSLVDEPSWLSYTIGYNKSCTSLPGTVYCNGPLPTNKQITVIVVQCNVAGCGQVRYDDIFSTEEPSLGIKALGIKALVFGVGLTRLVPVLVVVVMVIYVKRKKVSMSSNNLSEDENQNQNVPETQERDLFLTASPASVSNLDVPTDELQGSPRLMGSVLVPVLGTEVP